MHKMLKNVYVSNGINPYENLAIEDYLMSICKSNEVIMYLWQNDNTIVIGKHQNPYKECDLPAMKRDKVLLARRKSGGGAVFHDIGNLNFTFIAHKDNYSVDKHFQVILGALKEWNIIGQQTGRNDLTVSGKKISGNAFIHHKDVSCHHGTILVSAGLDKLGKYLTPSKIKIQSKGIDSVRSRVTNLIEFNAKINVDELKESLISKFDELYFGDFELKPIPVNERVEQIASDYKEWKWNIGESPKATLSKSKSTSWGNIEVELNIKNGQITHCMLNSDTLYDEAFAELARLIIGKEIQANILEETITSVIKDETICKDLVDLFIEFTV